MHTHWFVWQSVQIGLSGFVRTWSSYLSRKSGTVCVDFSSTASVLPPRRTSDCGRFELRCTEQKLPSRPEQWSGWISAHVPLCCCRSLVITPSQGPRRPLCTCTNTKKSLARGDGWRCRAQKNIWFASKYCNMKEEPSGLKARGHGDRGRRNLHHHPRHIGVS